MVDYNQLLYIDNNRQAIKALNFGFQDGRTTYITKNELSIADVEEISKTIGSKIRSATVYKDKLLIAGDFGLYFQDSEGLWQQYIKFLDGGDQYASQGWVENAIYSISVIPHTQGDMLAIIGNFETFDLINPASEIKVAGAKNFLVVRESEDGKLALPYPNIKEISKLLPMINANSFSLISTENDADIFSDDNIVSIYGNEDNIFVLDKGIYSFKDIAINDYGVVASDDSLYEPLGNLHHITLSSATKMTHYIRGEILSDHYLEDKVYISSGVNKIVDGSKYYQTLYYTLDITNNILIQNNTVNFKTIKSIPINSQQQYIALPQSNAGVSNTELAKLPLFISTTRSNPNNENTKKDTTFFGKGSREEPLSTNGLQEKENVFSVLKSELKGLMTITFSMRWFVVNQTPRNLKIIILKNGNRLQEIFYDTNDRVKSVSFSVDVGDSVSFVLDQDYYENFAIDFEAYVDNIDIFYASQLAFMNTSAKTRFTKIHNGISLPDADKQGSAVLMDTSRNVWFLKPENQSYFIHLQGAEEFGKRLVKYNLPSHIQPIDAVLGDGVIAVLSSNGDIYTWGKNTRGQLGVSTLSENAIIDQEPIKIDGDGGFKSIFVCNNTFYAIDDRNHMYAWGNNSIYYYEYSDNGLDYFDKNSIRKKISNGLIPGSTQDIVSSPTQIIIANGLRSTPTNRSCGIINADTASVAGREWSTISISSCDVYAIDQLGLMYHWGGYKQDNTLFELDTTISNIRPRLNFKTPSLIGAPGYSIHYFTAVELDNNYTVVDNYYYSTKLSNFLLSDSSISATSDLSSDTGPTFNNRAIDLLTLKNNSYKFSLSLEPEYIQNGLFIKNVIKGERICQIKIQDKTQNSITNEFNSTVTAIYKDVEASYNGLVIIDLEHQTILSGSGFADAEFSQLYLFYYNCYYENFNLNNPGRYSRVAHDSYIFENRYSDTTVNIAPLPNSYNRSQELTKQTSSVVFYQEASGNSGIWSRNSIDKDTNNSSTGISSLSAVDLSVGKTDNLFNHEILKYYHEKSQNLYNNSLYHSHLNLNNRSNLAKVLLKFRIFDNTCGTRIFNLCDGADCQQVNKQEQEHDGLTSLSKYTNIRLMSIISGELKIDSNIISWNLFTDNKTIDIASAEYAQSRDGIFYILPSGANSNGRSKYNYAYIMNDDYQTVVDKDSIPNFVNSKAFVLSLLLYQGFIIAGGYFPDGNSQINKDKYFMIWDHYNQRVLQPYGEG